MIKIEMKKILSFVLIFAMVINYFIPVSTVFAVADTTILSVSFRANEQVDNANFGIVQYSLDDGVNWNDIDANTDEGGLNIVVVGDNLKLRIVPNENYEIDYAGIELRLDDEPVELSSDNTLGIDTSEGYSVPSDVESVLLSKVEFREMNINDPGQGGGYNPPETNNQAHVTVTISGEELEYDHDWDNNATDFVFGINDSEMRFISKEEVNYTVENETIVGLETKESLGLGYNYDDSGKVTFHIRTQWNDVITSLKINNELYNTPQTKEALIEAYDNGGIAFDIENVPYEQNYSIEVIGRKQTEEETIMGNFGWTYDENTNEFSDDDKILHGVLDFVSAEYDNHTYTTIAEVNNAGGVFEWNDGVRGTNDPTGEATFPVGTILTLRLIPDAGYQLTSFDLNGRPFEPGDEVGLYTFEIGGGNWHLGAHFTEEGNVVQVTSENVRNGNIETNEEVQNGTLKLEVSNIGSMSPEREENFVNKAFEDEFEIDSYMDISLFNAIYKGGKKDANNNYQSWDTEVNNLADKATITLELKDDMTGKEVVLVHEKHNGNNVEYEIIETVYDENNNTVTFETDSFSTYALAIKESIQENYTVTSEDVTATFTYDEGHNFELLFVDILKLTPEQLSEMAGEEITEEQFNQIINLIKDNVKEYGSLLGLYMIEINDGPLGYGGEVNLRIPLTDEMKEYNTFKFVYLDDDNNFQVMELADFSIEGDYLVGTLPHLSVYALVGSSVVEEANPSTGDNIINYVSILGLNMIIFSGAVIYLKKKKNI